ncbi:hypothetical protein ACFE04_016764 [Oxalis oulophora]
MKFGDTFKEYLHGDPERLFNKYSHVEYKRLKKVLKSCTCFNKTSSSNSILHVNVNVNVVDDDNDNDNDSSVPQQQDNNTTLSLRDQFESCPVCDHKFFSELKKEALDVSGFFSSRVRHLLDLHVSGGFKKYVLHLRQCFKHDQLDLVQEGQLLIEYVTMNSIAIRKILKKYDKVHHSVNGKNFREKMMAEHLELLKSPWLIELGAFYLNSNGIESGEFREFPGFVSCDDLSGSQPKITLALPNSIKLEYDLTCAICLETVFNPYALSCGHLFCKLCACSAASVFVFQHLKTASPDSKCPVCREAGVYENSVHMHELDLLLKRECKDYWKERSTAEHAEMVKQSKEYWDMQTKFVGEGTCIVTAHMLIITMIQTRFRWFQGINYRDMVADNMSMAGSLEGISGDPFMGICISNVTIGMAFNHKKLIWNCTDVAGIARGASPLPCDSC